MPITNESSSSSGSSYADSDSDTDLAKVGRGAAPCRSRSHAEPLIPHDSHPRVSLVSLCQFYDAQTFNETGELAYVAAADESGDSGSTSQAGAAQRAAPTPNVLHGHGGGDLPHGSHQSHRDTAHDAGVGGRKQLATGAGTTEGGDDGALGDDEGDGGEHDIEEVAAAAEAAQEAAVARAQEAAREAMQAQAAADAAAADAATARAAVTAAAGGRGDGRGARAVPKRVPTSETSVSSVTPGSSTAVARNGEVKVVAGDPERELRRSTRGSAVRAPRDSGEAPLGGPKLPAPALGGAGGAGGPAGLGSRGPLPRLAPLDPTSFTGTTDEAAAPSPSAVLTVVDKDTGKTYRLDDMEEFEAQQRYTTFNADSYLGIGVEADAAAALTERGADEGSDEDDGAASGAGAKKKGGGFFSGLGWGKGKSQKERTREDTDEDAAEEGTVRVNTRQRDVKELTRLVRCQHVHTQSGPVWTMKFSHDGRFLASAGQEGVILVWRILGDEDSDLLERGMAARGPLPPGGPRTGRSCSTTSTSGSSMTSGAGSVVVSDEEGAAGLLRSDSARSRESARSHDESLGATTVSDSSVDGAAVSAASPEGPGDATTHALDTCPGVPLFDAREPYRRYKGHSNHVVDLAWSKTNFLLSASMDNYVRLWHVSRPECLHKFQHPDCVTSVDFHPTEDGYFLSGCFDKKLRVWNLETGRVVMWQSTPVMVTSSSFSPDGRMVVAGLYNGQCVFFTVQADGLLYKTQIECRNRRGPLRKGRKVTGVVFTGGGGLLVTTNDSRSRLYTLDDYSQTFKYIGLVNNNMQIKATCDASGDRIICGSEDKNVYLWRTRHDLYTPSINPRFTGYKKEKNRSVEFFRAHDDVVTVAIFAPPVGIAAERRRIMAKRFGLESPELLEAVSMVIVTAGMGGDIKVFENVGPPKRL